MLERIAEIKGVGLLHDANGKPHTCQKATLIYADNGRGKTTPASLRMVVSVVSILEITKQEIMATYDRLTALANCKRVELFGNSEWLPVNPHHA